MSKSIQLRNQFIDYFRDRAHTHVNSAPVIPFEDPTLLFINAGMNQFKDVFLEQGSRPYTRAVDSQKCIRVSGKHNDLDEVGLSPNHHTFFEMLGNWSFGDYYKREAIGWAWDLLVKILKIDPKRLYATVYKGDSQVSPDEEARQAWLELTGIKEERVSFHDAKDNFWEMGEVGPCGPCSEIHYDLGAEACTKSSENGHICKVNGDCGRIVELWNLVFIQYRRDGEGKLHDLPRKHVDTGAGLERLLRVIEGVDSNYETSLFTPLISELEQISGLKYSSADNGIPHRVAVDHVRALSFALADGVQPSNEGRGYVMRRILRRAARYGREIGLETPYLYKLVDPLIEIMGAAYPELKDRYDHIIGVIKSEEESFSRTLGRGLV
ncbi:MAG: alanine--tRNA ligase, partial [Calditrichaeota bacterium]|nr:alanine--tRNA ligase [Calditrichota bacterium]